MLDEFIKGSGVDASWKVKEWENFISPQLYRLDFFLSFVFNFICFLFFSFPFKTKVFRQFLVLLFHTTFVFWYLFLIRLEIDALVRRFFFHLCSLHHLLKYAIHTPPQFQFPTHFGASLKLHRSHKTSTKSKANNNGFIFVSYIFTLKKSWTNVQCSFWHFISDFYWTFWVQNEKMFVLWCARRELFTVKSNSPTCLCTIFSKF